MSKFRKFLLIVFALATAFTICVLGLPWLHIYTREIAALLTEYPVFFIVVETTAAISLAGAAFCFLKALFGPKNSDSILVAQIDGDDITVTRTAIASQATHIVEDTGQFKVKSCKVKAKRTGHVKVYLRIMPEGTCDVLERSVELHDSLSRGLALLCGNEIEAIEIEFLESKEFDKPVQASTYPTQSDDAISATDGIENVEISGREA